MFPCRKEQAEPGKTEGPPRGDPRSYALDSNPSSTYSRQASSRIMRRRLASSSISSLRQEQVQVAFLLLSSGGNMW